jgi:hypothetical protein
MFLRPSSQTENQATDLKSFFFVDRPFIRVNRPLTPAVSWPLWNYAAERNERFLAE